MDISSLMYRAETRLASLYQMMVEVRERDTEKLESLENEADTLVELISELEMVADRLAALLDGTE